MFSASPYTWLELASKMKVCASAVFEMVPALSPNTSSLTVVPGW